MTITASFHNPTIAAHNNLPGRKNDVLSIQGERSEYISIFVPPHVAEHTAAAFNRAMQAVPDPDAINEGWTYEGRSGVWLMSCPMPRTYLAQHDEVTGDGDPNWMFAEASSLIGLMDEIDDIEADHGCLVCHRLFDDAELAHCHDGNWRCDDCTQKWLKSEAEMAEMADDDKAHAAMEKAAGL